MWDAAWLESIEERKAYISDTKYYRLLRGEEDSGLYQKFERRFYAFVENAKKYGAQVLVIFIPDIVQINESELQEINQIVARICKRSNVAYLDMTPLFERAPSIQQLYLLPYDAHLSPEGHRIISEALEKEIKGIVA